MVPKTGADGVSGDLGQEAYLPRQQPRGYQGQVLNINYGWILFSCYSGAHGLPSGVGVFFGPRSEAAVNMRRRALVERRIELEELNTHSNTIEKQTANS